jgi:hypothetical protein
LYGILSIFFKFWQKWSFTESIPGHDVGEVEEDANAATKFRPQGSALKGTVFRFIFANYAVGGRDCKNSEN